MNEKGASFIRRKRKEERFTRLSNEMLQNDGLSWKARGLLSYMLSMPDDWVFYETELVKHSKKDGITSLRSAMKELKEFGYVVKEPQRDELGKITNWVTYVDEEPINHPDYRKPTIKETHNVDNQTLLTTNLLETNNNINTSSPKFSTFDMQASERLLELILINNPTAKKPNLEKWANDVRLMRERDNRTKEQIMYVIEWCQNDSFWKSNILSTSKLREKFDSLVVKIKSEKEKKPKQQHKKQTALGAMIEEYQGGLNNEGNYTTGSIDVSGNGGYLLESTTKRY